jgi:hypothetical protein
MYYRLTKGKREKSPKQKQTERGQKMKTTKTNETKKVNNKTTTNKERRKKTMKQNKTNKKISKKSAAEVVQETIERIRKMIAEYNEGIRGSFRLMKRLKQGYIIGYGRTIGYEPHHQYVNGEWKYMKTYDPIAEVLFRWFSNNETNIKIKNVYIKEDEEKGLHIPFTFEPFEKDFYVSIQKEQMLTEKEPEIRTFEPLDLPAEKIYGLVDITNNKKATYKYCLFGKFYLTKKSDLKKLEEEVKKELEFFKDDEEEQKDKNNMNKAA